MSQLIDLGAQNAAVTVKPTVALSPPASRSERLVDWRTRYRRRIVVSDIVVIAIAVAGGQLLRFGGDNSSVSGLELNLSYTALSAIIAACWVLALALGSAWHRKILGSGAPAYARVAKASFAVFGLLAVVSYLGKLEIARGYVAIAVPLGTAALLCARVSWRAWLWRRRRRGDMTSRTIVVGGASTATALAKQLDDEPLAGYQVVGLCLPAGDTPTTIAGFAVVGSFDNVISAAHRLNASSIAIAKTDLFPPAKVRRLAWSLEHTGLDLVIAPMLTDITGPRIHAEPVPGLPLVHMERPRLRGPQLWLKTAFDIFSAAVGLVLLSPLILAVALAIKLDDGGPVFFRQERVGIAQSRFCIWKFRTMVPGAELLKAKERRSARQECSPFFKAAEDSRVTRLGRILRRTSIDELPQLINVLQLQMSVVGPRPLVPGEGSEFDQYVTRRALVKPGLTGLWQISGRSQVTGDQRARMDLLYVENWSLLGDLTIVARTISAVLVGRGAR